MRYLMLTLFACKSRCMLDAKRNRSAFRNSFFKVLILCPGFKLFGSLNIFLQKGNLVTDAMVWAYRHSQDNISLSMINSGGIRASFDEGNITMEDLLISFPFRNTFDLVFIQGNYLRAALEHSVANMRPDGRNEAGRFLQVVQ